MVALTRNLANRARAASNGAMEQLPLGEQDLESKLAQIGAEMTVLHKQIDDLTKRLDALERRRQMTPRRSVAIILSVLFALVPLSAVGLLLYYMIVGL